MSDAVERKNNKPDVALERKAYTPNTGKVRKAYKNSVVDVWGTKKPNAEFDRWLAEVIREAKEEAWYLGASSAVNYALNGSLSLPENPFEKEK